MSNEGVVIYVDPYAGEGYDMPADIVIVTHEHSDHNQVDLVTLKDDGVILTRRFVLPSLSGSSIIYM